MKPCLCREGYIGPKHLPPNRWHRCAYVAQRNAHVPFAVAEADAQMPLARTDERKAAWNGVFHREMRKRTGA